MYKIVRAAALGAALSSALFLSACNESADTADAGSSDETLNIGFFGFSKTNSFAQAAFAGISEYAEENDANAEFVDPNFDVQVQVQQLKDALTSNRYDVWIVQANDGVAVEQTIQEAVDAGITVVAEFTPIGPDFETLQPQVPGTLSLVDDPKRNGTALGELSVDACKDAGVETCEVAYLQGFSAQPIDVVRTEAFLAAVDQPGIKVVANVEGGYAQDTGRGAVQDILQANPDVDVIAGASSAALLGAIDLPGIDDVRIVGNGSSTQAVTAVQEGDFYAVYVFAEKTAGAKAAEMGLAAARGETVDPPYVGYDELTPFGVLGTQENLEGYTGEYSD